MSFSVVLAFSFVFATWRTDAADMYGVVQFGHGIQYDALGLHHGTLKQTELLVLQLLGQLALPTGLGHKT